MHFVMLVTLVIYFICIISFSPERHLLNVNQVRLPMTATTVQSVWQPSGTANIWRRLSPAQMGSRWSSSPMTRGTSRRQRRADCWFTNVICCWTKPNASRIQLPKTLFEIYQHFNATCRHGIAIHSLIQPLPVSLHTSMLSNSSSCLHDFVTYIYSFTF